MAAEITSIDNAYVQPPHQPLAITSVSTRFGSSVSPEFVNGGIWGVLEFEASIKANYFSGDNSTTRAGKPYTTLFDTTGLLQ
jgi:hypothetical protein